MPQIESAEEIARAAAAERAQARLEEARREVDALASTVSAAVLELANGAPRERVIAVLGTTDEIVTAWAKRDDEECERVASVEDRAESAEQRLEEAQGVLREFLPDAERALGEVRQIARGWAERNEDASAIVLTLEPIEALLSSLDSLDQGGGGSGVGVPEEISSTPWRVGRKVGRTIYLQRGPEPSDDDPLIGMLDSAGLALKAVAAVNEAEIARLQGSRCVECGGPKPPDPRVKKLPESSEGER